MPDCSVCMVDVLTAVGGIAGAWAAGLALTATEAVVRTANSRVDRKELRIGDAPW